MENLKSNSGNPNKQAQLLEALRSLTPEAQEFLTDLSSQFMENDVYVKFKASPKNIQCLTRELKRLKIDEPTIDTVMNFFNFPYGKK